MLPRRTSVRFLLSEPDPLPGLPDGPGGTKLHDGRAPLTDDPTAAGHALHLTLSAAALVLGSTMALIRDLIETGAQRQARNWKPDAATRRPQNSQALAPGRCDGARRLPSLPVACRR